MYIILGSEGSGSLNVFELQCELNVFTVIRSKCYLFIHKRYVTLRYNVCTFKMCVISTEPAIHAAVLVTLCTVQLSYTR